MTAAEHTDAERAHLARIEQADPAPEAWERRVEAAARAGFDACLWLAQNKVTDTFDDLPPTVAEGLRAFTAAALSADAATRPAPDVDSGEAETAPLCSWCDLPATGNADSAYGFVPSCGSYGHGIEDTYAPAVLAATTPPTEGDVR